MLIFWKWAIPWVLVKTSESKWAIDWAAGCITYQRLNSERFFSHLFACSVHSDNRARNSDGGGVKSYAWENKRRLGREGRFPSPFSLQSFFFLVNFSPSLYHLNARNRLLICRSFCSVIWIFLPMEHWSLLLSLLNLFQEFWSWGQRKEMWGRGESEPPLSFSSFAPHSTVRTPATG